MVFQNRHGWRWFHAEASFSLEKLDVEQLYKDVQLLNRLFSKANGKLYTANDDKMSRTRIDEMNV